MKKLSALIALLLLAGQHAGATQQEDEKSEAAQLANEHKLKASFAHLVKAGIIHLPKEDEPVYVDPEFIEYLRKSGTIKPGDTKAGTICVGPVQ